MDGSATLKMVRSRLTRSRVTHRINRVAHRQRRLPGLARGVMVARGVARGRDVRCPRSVAGDGGTDPAAKEAAQRGAAPPRGAGVQDE